MVCCVYFLSIYFGMANPITNPTINAIIAYTGIMEFKYVFSGWSDGFSSSTRTITLNSDASLTVYYKAEAPPQTPSYWIYIAIASLLALMVIIVVIYRRR